MSNLVRAMIRSVASATGEDIVAVAGELSKLPDNELQMLHDMGVGVRVCREAVTDYRVDLRSQAPRGWPQGVDWTSVPGCYCPDEKNVVIATIAAPGGGRTVPPRGVKHGAWNLVIHETMHADDYIAGRRRCINPAFLAARAADIEFLSDYEAQDGQAGYEETYAESAAHYFGGDRVFGTQCPALEEFWRSAKLPIAAGSWPNHESRAAKSPIGSVSRGRSGSIVLDLRAEGPDAAVGHALIVVSPGSPTYAAVQTRLQSQEKQTQPDVAALRAGAAQQRAAPLSTLLDPF